MIKSGRVPELRWHENLSGDRRCRRPRGGDRRQWRRGSRHGRGWKSRRRRWKSRRRRLGRRLGCPAGDGGRHRWRRRRHRRNRIGPQRGSLAVLLGRIDLRGLGLRRVGEFNIRFSRHSGVLQCGFELYLPAAISFHNYHRRYYHFVQVCSVGCNFQRRRSLCRDPSSAGEMDQVKGIIRGNPGRGKRRRQPSVFFSR